MISDLEKPEMCVLSHDSGRKLSAIHQGRKWIQLKDGDEFLSVVVATGRDPHAAVSTAINERMKHRHVAPKVDATDGVAFVEVDVTFLETIPVFGVVMQGQLVRFARIESSQGERFLIATYKLQEGNDE